MIDAELAAQIRHLFVVERWRVNTIARHLRIHHSTVRRALEQASVEVAAVRPQRPSRLDAYVLLATLGK